MALTAGLVLHFLLELAAMAALVYWGFAAHDLWWQKMLLGVGLPLAAASLWGIFRVPNDPGPATIAIPGPLRLLLELVVMAGAALALYAARRTGLALAFAVLVAIDYALMYRRVTRLLGG